MNQGNLTTDLFAFLVVPDPSPQKISSSSGKQKRPVKPKKSQCNHLKRLLSFSREHVVQ